MKSPDPRSDKVLELLRGYGRRQPWVREDLLVVQNLFDALDAAHATIDAWEVRDAEHCKYEAQLQRRIEYLEYRVKEEQAKGVWSYLKMLVVPCR